MVWATKEERIHLKGVVCCLPWAALPLEVTLYSWLVPEMSLVIGIQKWLHGSWKWKHTSFRKGRLDFLHIQIWGYPLSEICNKHRNQTNCGADEQWWREISGLKDLYCVSMMPVWCWRWGSRGWNFQQLRESVTGQHIFMRCRCIITLGSSVFSDLYVLSSYSSSENWCWKRQVLYRCSREGYDSQDRIKSWLKTLCLL